jgi:predicted small secreted protein
LTALIQISGRTVIGGLDWVLEELWAASWGVRRSQGVYMRNRLAITALTLLVLVGSAGLLGACNTTAGAGKDMSAAGEAIEKSAEENKGY